MPADGPEEILVGFDFGGMRSPSINRTSSPFKMAVFILVVYEPTAKTAKICCMQKKISPCMVGPQWTKSAGECEIFSHKEIFG